MRKTHNHLAILMFAAFCGLTNTAQAANNPPQPSPNLVKDLADLDHWLGNFANGQAWRQFLMLDQVRQAAAQPGQDAAEVVATALNRFESQTTGLQQLQ